jgi:hypothetical protein
MVTKQPKELAPLMVDAFGQTDAVMRRGYTILAAQRPGGVKEGASLFRVETDVW